MKNHKTKEQLQQWLKENKENLINHSKNIGKWLYSTLIGIPKDTLHSLRRAATLWDMHISEKEFISQLSKKDHSFLKKSLQFIEKWILRWTYIVLLASSIQYGVKELTQHTNHFLPIEITKEKDNYNTIIQEIANKKTENTYRDSNIDFFNQDKFYEEYKKDILQWWEIKLIHDVWMSFYVVQKWDNPTKIREKLKKIPEFEYLNNEKYNPKNKLSSFNVPAKSLVPNLLIPIPLPQEVREISLEDFTYYAVQALEEMKNDKYYSAQIKELLEHITHDELIATMITFARCETAQDHISFSDNIWSVTYHRREPHMNAFSFTPFHILMEKNADGKTAWPWLQARFNLQLTEWQTYHPKNACKLFLWYRCEKTKKKQIQDYLPITDTNIISTAKLYNWSKTYEPKLRRNYTYILDQLNIKTGNRSQTTKLTWESFVFVGYNSTGTHKIYKYINEQSWNPWSIANKLIEENPNISLVDVIICDQYGKKYNPEHNFKLGDTAYIKIK